MSARPDSPRIKINVEALLERMEDGWIVADGWGRVHLHERYTELRRGDWLEKCGRHFATLKADELLDALERFTDRLPADDERRPDIAALVEVIRGFALPTVATGAQ